MNRGGVPRHCPHPDATPLIRSSVVHHVHGRTQPPAACLRAPQADSKGNRIGAHSRAVRPVTHIYRARNLSHHWRPDSSTRRKQGLRNEHPRSGSDWVFRAER